MHKLLEKLYAREDLSKDEAKALFQKMIKGNLDPVIITSILISLRIKKECYQEISGAASALLEEAQSFSLPDYSYGDIVGTGGDKSNTINISTLSALIAASLGLKIAKHGNRSVSSKCGSFDLLEVLKIPFHSSPQVLREQLDKEGVCFLFAPLFHPGIKHVMPIRTQLKTKTIFNILGPLVNPARPSYQMVGVYSEELIEPMAKVLDNLGLKRGFVVHGRGLDEIAPHAQTQVIEINHGELKRKTISAKTFGFKEFSLEKIKGGDKNENLEISQNILAGKGTQEQKQILAMNVSPLLLLENKVKNLEQGAQMVMDQLCTDEVFKLTQRLANNG